MPPLRDKQVTVDSHTPVNYTASDTTLGGHISGIDTALGGGAAEYWLEPVAAIGMVGSRTVSQINSLPTVTGLSAVSTNSGTPSAGTSDALVAGDIAEYDGTSWKKIVANSGGFPPNGTRAALAQLLFSPYNTTLDKGAIVTWDGTSLTPAIDKTMSDGSGLAIRNDLAVYDSRRMILEFGGTGVGVWQQAIQQDITTPTLAEVLAEDNETDGTTANSIRVLQSSNISNIFFDTDVSSDDDFSTGDAWVGIRGTRTLTIGGINNLDFITYAGRSADTAYSGVWDYSDDSVGLSIPKVVMRMRHAGSDLQISALRSSTTAIILGNAGSSTGGIRILPSGATRTIHTTGANALGLGTNGVTYLTISSTGTVSFANSSTVTIDTLHGNGDGSNLGATAAGDRWDRVFLRGYINWQSADLATPGTNEVNLCPNAGDLYMIFDASERLGFIGRGSNTVRLQTTLTGGVLELAGSGGVMVSALSNGVGFYGTTPVAQQTAFTQTYATATVTHAARSAASLTDNSGGTANTTIAAITNANNAGSADVVPTADAIADLAAQINNLITDQQNTAQVLNQVVDHLQAHGLFA